MTLASDDAARLMVDVLVKATVILALAAAASLALRRSSAAARHMVWFLAMGGLLLLPVLAVTLPVLSVPVPNWFAAESVQPPVASDSVAVSGLVAEEPSRASTPANTVTQRQSVTMPPTSLRAKAGGVPRQPATPHSAAESPGGGSLFAAAAPVVSATEFPNGAGGLFDAAPPAAPPAATASVAEAPVATETTALAVDTAQPATVPWALWLLVVWVAGVLAILAMRIIGSVCVWRRAAESAPVTSGAWSDLAEELAAQLGLGRRVRLLESDRPLMPVTWGMVQPAVLLPPAGEWSEERRRVVLLHELAHVKRWDCLTQAVAQVACAVYWFHPLAWYAARRLRLEREAACDDLVLGAGLQAPDYAAHLLDLARSLRGPACPSMAAVAMARRSHIESRLRGILDTARSRRPIGRRGLVLAALAAVCLLSPIAACRPVASPEPSKTETPGKTEPTSNTEVTGKAETKRAAAEEKDVGLFSTTSGLDGLMVKFKEPSPAEEEEGQFINLLESAVNAASDPQVAAWSNEGGSASVQIIHGVAVITQTPEGHRKVTELLQLLTQAGAIKAETAQALPEEAESPWKARTRRQLDQKIDIDMAKVPVPAVLDFLREKAGLNIVVDPRVADSGIDLAAAVVDIKASQKPAAWVLGQALPVSCGSRVEDGYVWVTKRAVLERSLPVGLYRVWSKDGRLMGVVKDTPFEWAVLERVIHSVASPMNDPYMAEWADSGGPAQLKFFNDTLLVAQTSTGQAQVASLLARLAEKGALGAGSGEAFATKTASPELAALRHTLEELVDLDFEKTSLPKVLKFMGELKPGLAIQIDPSVAANGIDLSSRLVDIKVKQVPVAAVLDLILGWDLAYELTPNGVRVEDRRLLERTLPTVVYKVKMP
jgi:beta-lactamase regulating signal transducer with metallopeptidase domain